jgi:DNA-binding NtrC family response regulator
MEPKELARRLLESGNFRDAKRELRADSFDPVLALEISYYLGDSHRVTHEGSTLLRSKGLTNVQRARISRILAAQLRDEGQFIEAWNYCRSSLQLLLGTDDAFEEALCYAELLEAECANAAFDAARPTALHTRRAALRAADAGLLARIHLVFGRLEARNGHWDIAFRHFGVVRRYLEERPNLFLQASLALDESSTKFLLGDFTAALDCATLGGQAARESGWQKGVAVSAANCAYFAVRLGLIREAEKHLSVAEAQRFTTPSLQIALLETRGQLALLRGDLTTAEELLSLRPALSKRVFSWYTLSLADSEIRVLLRARRWAAAVDRADRALSVAAQHDMGSFVAPLQLRRAIAMQALGRRISSRDFPFTCGHHWSLATTATYWSARGALATDSNASDGYHARALRILDAVGDASTRLDVEHLVTTPSVPAIAPPTLESAVSLLDLAEHPLVLAREAFAVVTGSGCVESAALVAHRGEETRVLDTFAWDSRAVQRPTNSEGADVLKCGFHHKEQLQILATVRDDIESRCTWWTIRKLVDAAATLREARREEKQRAALWPAESLEGDPESIWVSEAIQEVLRDALRIAPSGLTVLLTGESGTGKEVMARAIHAASGRTGPMIAFNCTAVPREMFESQLFGFRKGSFTGAEAAYSGVIRAAEGGTLFLDEIGDVPLELQPKLLRFLEQREIQPIGEPTPVKVDVRVVAATNIDLERHMREGRLRNDLFYRLNVVPLRLPPLRERREEIPALVEHYLRRFGQEHQKERLRLSDEALEYLLLHPWPGNLRQLANEVQRMVALAEPGTTFTASHLSPAIRASRRTVASTEPDDSAVHIPLDQPLPRAVEQLERAMVEAALEKTGGLEEAAKLLGISRKGLFLKRKRWGMQQDD